FLVTNGMNSHWAKITDLVDEWSDHEDWTKRWIWTENYIGEIFFDNSFGINVLITCKSGKDRYALFCERGGKVAVGKGVTVASADEGLRRRFKKKVI
ncbi:hypothetical protein VU04_11885, partial [Desulfobulbus sp. TB]|nr:hypothetical protein [Desulfobulbus sp. TB]